MRKYTIGSLAEEIESELKILEPQLEKEKTKLVEMKTVGDAYNTGCKIGGLTVEIISKKYFLEQLKTILESRIIKPQGFN